jgi:phosphoribosyl-AMP cyclohydrolase|tara:strand:+ start:828 stop:1157 length:330 start_codon:yes stop_codon:yes gene_type:complete
MNRINIKELDFSKGNGLIPVVVQESSTKEVLMLAYVNEESLNQTLKTGFAHYWSRSRNKLWKKGESSGNVQKIVDVLVDCDNDTILYNVEQTGPACHTGTKTCFEKELK